MQATARKSAADPSLTALEVLQIIESLGHQMRTGFALDVRVMLANEQVLRRVVLGTWQHLETPTLTWPAEADHMICTPLFPNPIAGTAERAMG